MFSVFFCCRPHTRPPSKRRTKKKHHRKSDPKFAHHTFRIGGSEYRRDRWVSRISINGAGTNLDATDIPAFETVKSQEETQSNVRHAIFMLKVNKKMRNLAKCRFLMRCGCYIGPLQGGSMYGMGESLLDGVDKQLCKASCAQDARQPKLYITRIHNQKILMRLSACFSRNSF